ncbi:MAG: hypothetical protein AB2A00_13235 [Myxococcota bacterium]
MSAIQDFVPPEVFKALQERRTDYVYVDITEVEVRNAANPDAPPLRFKVRELNVSDTGRLKLAGHVLRPDLLADDRNVVVLTVERGEGQAAPAGPVGVKAK